MSLRSSSFVLSPSLVPLLGELKAALGQQSLAVLSAAPGIGKTTLLPLVLRSEPWLQGKKVLMLQPRRLAARSVARRMSELLGEPLGKSVGYRVRRDSVVGPQTQIEVMTEGIFLRRIQAEPELADVGLVIFDEFHERSLPSDLSFAFAREVLASLRSDLRLLVMSATLDQQFLATCFSGVPLIQGGSSLFPVETVFAAECERQKIVPTLLPVVQRAYQETSGDVLVFLPGVGEVRRAAEGVRQRLNSEALVMELYGELDYESQQKAILPDTKGRRKIVLSTPVAETSITIEGITAVVDSGWERVPRYDPGRGASSLELQRISAESAVQRAGRAGRLGPGRCYRMFRDSLVPRREPAVKREDLSVFLLEAALWGISGGLKEWRNFPWVEVPGAGACDSTIRLLQLLQLLDESGQILPLGRKVLQLPVHPRLGSMIFAASKTALRCACELAVIIEERRKMSDRESNVERHLQALSAEQRRAAEELYSLASRMREADGGTSARAESIASLLFMAYPDRLAKRRSSAVEEPRYLLASGGGANLPRNDSLAQAPFLVVADMLLRGAEAEVSLAVEIGETELRACLGDRLVKQRECAWNEQEESVIAEETERFGAIVFASRPAANLDAKEVAAALLGGIRSGKGLAALPWDEESSNLLQRMQFFSKLFPELGPPSTDEAALLETLEDWLLPSLQGMRRLRQLETLAMKELLLNRLPWDLRRQLQNLLPERLELPKGRLRTLQYHFDREIVLSATLQELLGWKTTPIIAEGRAPLLIEILSPARRPLQRTNDLAGFWRGSYAEVRKEMRGRYPKHDWPENPLEPGQERKR